MDHWLMLVNEVLHILYGSADTWSRCGRSSIMNLL